MEKERDNILNRKEMVTGENMQLIMEAEEFHASRVDLSNQLRTAQNRVRELEKENARLTFEFDSKVATTFICLYLILGENISLLHLAQH